MKPTIIPLRYPGGKGKIYPHIKNVIIANNCANKTYVEPFCGGFGVRLLCEGIVKKAIMNDLDIHIFHFWQTVLYETDKLLKLIQDTPINLPERDKQKQIYLDSEATPLDDGFATLYLNRVNHNGIIHGGPIGGTGQVGQYKLGCRYNKTEIARRIEAIAHFKGKLEIYNADTIEFMAK